MIRYAAKVNHHFSFATLLPCHLVRRPGAMLRVRWLGSSDMDRRFNDYFDTKGLPLHKKKKKGKRRGKEKGERKYKENPDDNNALGSNI
jgi:hypothetical protein